MPWSWWLVPLGFLVGAVGTLIGAGGGFLLVPLLLLLSPGQDPTVVTAASLAVVCLNGLSGTLAYARMRRIDYRAGSIFAAAAAPGVILGVYVNDMISKRFFAILVGGFVVAGALALLWQVRFGRPPQVARGRQSGVLARGAFLSVGVGFLSSLMGIGGGIIHVPALIYWLGYSVHGATATSHFVLALSSLLAVGIHASAGHLDGVWAAVLALGAGVIPGAQVGARVSKHVHGKWILYALAVGLLLVGIRTLAGGLWA